MRHRQESESRTGSCPVKGRLKSFPWHTFCIVCCDSIEDTSSYFLMSTSLGKLKECSGTSLHKPCLQRFLDVRHKPSNSRNSNLESRLNHRHSIERRLACFKTSASSDPGQPELPNIDPLSAKNQDAGATYSLQDTKVGLVASCCLPPFMLVSRFPSAI